MTGPRATTVNMGLTVIMNMISKKITLDLCIYFSVVNVGQTHIYKPLLDDKNNFRLLCLINNFTASHDFSGLLLKI